MPADNPRWRNLVVVKAHRLRWLTKQILLEVSINAAKHGVSNQRPMLVVWAEPLCSADKKVLLHHRPMKVCIVGGNGVGDGAAGPNIPPSRRHDAPVPGQ